jgi:uncharacterized protein (TIGR03435 family)
MTAWTDAIGWTLVHFVWEGTCVAVLTATVLRVLRRSVPQTRYVMACAGLLIALLMPPVTAFVLLSGNVQRPVDGGAAGTAAATVAAPAIHVVQPLAAGAPPALRVRPEVLASALSFFVAGWLAGVLLLTGRLVSGWWRIRQIHADALGLPSSAWFTAAGRIAARLDLRRAVHVVDSPNIDTPAVIGWLQPVILLPIAALSNLTPAQVHAILAHELAHVRRHDFVVNLLQTVAETVLFYHPGVWWLSARIRTEREHCCDDVAVGACGDPVLYAEALTALAAAAHASPDHQGTGRRQSLAVAATSGSLLHRVRRLLQLPEESRRRGAAAPIAIGAAALLVLLAATRIVIVAQSPLPADVHTTDHRLGPPDVNRILGFDLFPGPVRYATDDPAAARAWDVKVASPRGDMSFIGFTARGLIRYAYGFDTTPVVDVPPWLDTQALTLRGETSTDQPADIDYRTAIRAALEDAFGISVRRGARLFPVYGLQVIERGRLGPNIKPSALACIDDYRDIPPALGPQLHGGGEKAYAAFDLCGIDHTLTGMTGRKATFEQLARGLRGFGMGGSRAGDAEREVIDQTGLTGVYDFEINLGLLPLAAIATAHPAAGVGFGPLIRTFPQALEEQLGLRLVPMDAARDVAVVEVAGQARRAGGAVGAATLTRSDAPR